MAPQTEPSIETSPPVDFGGHRWPTIGSWQLLWNVWRTNAEIAFVSGVTDIGLDEELLYGPIEYGGADFYHQYTDGKDTSRSSTFNAIWGLVLRLGTWFDALWHGYNARSVSPFLFWTMPMYHSPTLNASGLLPSARFYPRPTWLSKSTQLISHHCSEKETLTSWIP